MGGPGSGPRKKAVDPIEAEIKRAVYRARKREYMAKRRSDKPDIIAASKKRWAIANRDRLAAKSRERHRRDPEKSTIRHRRWKIQKFGLRRSAEKILLERAHAVVPRTLPPDVRGDVHGALILAVYEGRFPYRLRPEHAKKLITEHYRQFSKFTTVSLDEIVHDGASRGDLMGIY